MIFIDQIRHKSKDASAVILPVRLLIYVLSLNSGLLFVSVGVNFRLRFARLLGNAGSLP